MKRLGSISCICSTILLSACSLHQPQPTLTDEDIAAQLRAACELDTALELEEKRLIEEEQAALKAREEERARRNAEEKAREEAERKAEEEEEARRVAEEKAREEAERKAEEEEEARRVAEEKAREEAERKAEEEEKARKDAEQKARKEKAAEEKARKSQAKDEVAESSSRRTPRLLSSRGNRHQKPESPEEIVPTAEQQKTAKELLSKQAKSKPANAEKNSKPGQRPTSPPAEEPKNVQDEVVVQLPGSVTTGALRTRRFAPPEETISRDDNDEPLPNSVEMRGFRSPVMKGNLPMNIDGKIIKEN